MEAKERTDVIGQKRKQASADALDEDWWLQSNPNDGGDNDLQNAGQTDAKVRLSDALPSIRDIIY